ncbi:DUF3307 domain-containing protein [Petrimonas sp.]|uniref:DUF3307 domain-containing protein n=1 Tax=Petrimonas sp. TaxID=2023866 RepID=UPI003F512563
MIVVVKLILAHLIGDFVLQPTSWVEKKEKNGIKSLTFYLHGLIHGVLAWLVLWNFRYWPLALAVTIVHIGIDITKLYFQKKNNKTRWFIIDQGLHVLSILVLWYIFFTPQISLKPSLDNPDFWIYLTAILFLTLVCGIVIQVFLANWTENIDIDKEKSLPNAGRYIGILERLLVFIFVVLGRWEAIGFLIAAKSVFRFGDLKDSRNRKLTEYILIGTLLSFGIAIVTGILVLYLTSL